MPDPRLIANFRTDARGVPKFKDRGRRRHYKIVIEVENPPKDTYAATFSLDPSYYDSLREITPDEAGAIRLAISSYGDYAVAVKLRTSKGVIELNQSLARSLREGIRRSPALTVAGGDTGSSDDAVADALDYIARH